MTTLSIEPRAANSIIIYVINNNDKESFKIEVHTDGKKLMFLCREKPLDALTFDLKKKMSIEAMEQFYLEEADLRKKLWEDNELCPQCGGKANLDIKAAETGCNYCSVECAGKHVKANEPEGGY